MFEEFLENQELTDIISCVLLMHTKEKNPTKHDYGISGGGYPIPLNPTTEALVLLIATINFIGFCLQALEKIATMM